MLRVEELSVRYGELVITDRLSFSVGEGDWLMVVGPNGAGKSTLISAISQCVEYTGKILFESRDVASLRPRELARLIGVVRQSYNVGYSFTVEEIVRMGRYAYQSGLLSGGTGGDDARIIHDALTLTGMEPMRLQNVTTLSGGELQRTFLAQTLAQEPRLLILDEPTSHLDLVYQKQVFELLSEWLKKPGRAIISVVHDLSLARAYGTHALLIDRGVAASHGIAAQALSEENLRKVYRMDVGEWMRRLLGQWVD